MPISLAFPLRGLLASLLPLILALLQGCGGSGSDGDTGSVSVRAPVRASSVARASAEPAGDNCPYGGSKVVAGIDSNGSGVLEDAEVTATSYVCNGAPGAAGTPGPASLVNIRAESAGSQCAQGGVGIDSGLDTNGNGVLDAVEIGTTRYVCNGAAGAAGSNAPASLVSVLGEPAGSNCAQGGTRIVAGIDANANGLIEAGEIGSTAYVCQGGNGTNGTNGLNTLISSVSEPAGANCTHGGTKIISGLDVNADNLLDPQEIGSTTYVCQGGDGLPGTNGTNGLNTLISSVSEPAGADCPYGGIRITSGLDLNADNVLDPQEVGSLAFVCHGAPGATLSWVDVVGTAVQAQSNTGYIAHNDAAQVVVTLPANPAVGDLIRVDGAGAGGWTIAQNAGQAVYTRNLGGGGGAVWTPRESVRSWWAVASSADGTKLVAVVRDGQIYTSTDSGASWTARESNRDWRSVASSADGSKLVAVAWGNQIYTSTDSGVSWTARETSQNWVSVASSADGSKLVAVVYGGQIYTSNDSGVNWTAHESDRGWWSVASSADGSRLVAVAFNGQIYTSTDSGVSWTARESNRYWQSVASSADGSKLVAASKAGIYTSIDGGMSWTAHETDRAWVSVVSSADGGKLAAAESFGGRLYTSNASTTPGTDGGISGAQFDAVELQYVGGGMFNVLNHEGSLTLR